MKTELASYVSPSTEFKKMELACHIEFTANMSNIGNSPAVEIDFIPRIVSEIKRTLLDATLGERIECISIKDGDFKNILLIFYDIENKFVELLLSEHTLFLTLVVIYKNSLGMSFKQEIRFAIEEYFEDLEGLKLCLKTIRTAEIDYTAKAEEFESLMEKGNKEEAYKIIDEINTELKKKFEDKDKISLRTFIVSGSFLVSPISESEYKKLIAEKEEMQKKGNSTVEGSPLVS